MSLVESAKAVLDLKNDDYPNDGEWSNEAIDAYEALGKAVADAEGMVLVPKSIHPLDTQISEAVIALLANPPSAEKYSDQNDYYNYWWKELLAAAKVKP